MEETVTTGDITLTARPATAETFAAYGSLLAPGDSRLIGKRARVLVSLTGSRPAPRRVSTLSRYPDAQRAVVSASAGPIWVVVAGEGDSPSAPPAAFTVPAGMAVLLGAGVWHAGPFLLDEGVLVEMLEAPGGVDRFDRIPLRELLGAEAARVVLPDEPGARAPGIDLRAHGAVLLDAELSGRLALACIGFEDLVIEREVPGLADELDEVVQGLRSMWGRVTDLEQVASVAANRALFRDLGMDPAHVLPASETLLTRALEGGGLAQGNALLDALGICSLRMGVPLAAYDGRALCEQILVRIGGAGEACRTTDDRRIGLDGRPMLCDQGGPFGSPAGDDRRAAVRGGTRQALVVLFLPPTTPPDAAKGLLDGVAETVGRHAGGREAGRALVR